MVTTTKREKLARDLIWKQMMVTDVTVLRKRVHTGYFIRAKYGLSIEDVIDMWNDQQGKCAICGIQMVIDQTGRGGYPQSYVIDHDHKTNKVRGLLCSHCNLSLAHYERLKQIGLDKIDHYLKKGN